MNSIIQQFNSSNKILVVCHANPDGDAIGSLIALGLALETLNKKITLYCESPIPAVYRFLPAVHRVVKKIGRLNFDAAVILDCGDLSRVGKAVSFVKQIPVIVNIDHHVTNTGFGHLQLIDTSACATAEIVYRLIKQMGLSFDKPIATSIYTGILADTGSFRFSNTNKAAFSICQEMVEIGVDPYNIAQHVYGTYSLSRIKLLNLALDSIELSKNGKLSIMTLTKDMFDETHTQSEDVDGLINYAKRIEDVEVAALIQEQHNGKKRSKTPNRFHVSLRSDGAVDVAAIASLFGGGGHSSAAG
ncbi:MAG: bifunctional oligoribonuclease/PAP phosphatase NrnA, partial [Desulfobacterales bacterium]